MTERSVLRLSGERAGKKQAHWQSVAVAACEQCGANQVPLVHQVLDFSSWLKACGGLPVGQSPPASFSHIKLLLSLGTGALALRDTVEAAQHRTEGHLIGVTVLSGPEGGLSPVEVQTALAVGFVPVTLGPRVLRSETAALVALAALAT
jgi:16S rRNA (uracil1498-N3)-methyltransferase